MTMGVHWIHKHKDTHQMTYTIEQYNAYAAAFIADDMTPLSYTEWLRVQLEADKDDAVYALNYIND